MFEEIPFAKESPTSYSYYYPARTAHILGTRNLIKSLKLIRNYESVKVGKYFNVFIIAVKYFLYLMKKLDVLY